MYLQYFFQKINFISIISIFVSILSYNFYSILWPRTACNTKLQDFIQEQIKTRLVSFNDSWSPFMEINQLIRPSAFMATQHTPYPFIFNTHFPDKIFHLTQQITSMQWVKRMFLQNGYLSILTGKKHPKIKLQRLWKIRIWTFGLLVN